MEQEVILCYDGLDVRSPGIKKEMKNMAPHQNDDPMHNLKVAFEPPEGSL